MEGAEFAKLDFAIRKIRRNFEARLSRKLLHGEVQREKMIAPIGSTNSPEIDSDRLLGNVVEPPVVSIPIVAHAPASPMPPVDDSIFIAPGPQSPASAGFFRRLLARLFG